MKYADEKQENLHLKFPKNHYLSNKKNLESVLMHNTFLRRNFHRIATDYLKIPLHPYQAIILYFMGICRFIVLIACRAGAKSFIIAIYGCCKCIIKPKSKIVIASGTKGQGNLIVSEKIKNELMGMSPVLQKEILNIKDNQNNVIVYFRNGSTITVVPASENARGNRSTDKIGEEFRQIDKFVDDSVLSPFQIIRQVPYLQDPFYADMKELQESPISIYISSSWHDPHWMWGIVDTGFDEMLKQNPYCLFSLDESITLKHNIRTIEQMEQEKKKLDPITWRIEYENERLKENTHAFFTYAMLKQNQNLRKPFYPRITSDVINRKKNIHAVAKQNGEIRIISCDMAFVENKHNDNSIFTCMRLLPESVTYNSQNNNNSSVEIKQGYRRIVPYIESIQGGDTGKQAIRIRQLYEDFDADYIVLDVRNAGISVYDLLAKTMYDEERDCEYSPLSCMNDDNLANRIKIAGASSVIFAITASQKLNSDIALNMRNVLIDKKIDLLVTYNEALEEILPKISEYSSAINLDNQLFYEKPFLETQSLISEMTSLMYEKLEQTGQIRISEQGGNRKDRYTSCSYGSYFASLLEQDLLSDNSDYEFATFIN